MPGRTSGQAQAAAFRRTLDFQAIQRDPLRSADAAYDATLPIDATALRAALADGARAQNLPATFAAAAVVPPRRADPVPAGDGGAAAPPREPEEPSPRHGRGNGPNRLRTTVGISALLAAAAGIVLVLTTGGRTGSPFAPSALPGARASAGPTPSSGGTQTDGATPSSAGTGASAGNPAPGGSGSARPTPSADPGPSASASARPTASPSPTGPPAGPPSDFVTLTVGATTPAAEIEAVQDRLAQLRLLRSVDGGSAYRFNHGHTDPAGTYGQATQDAIAVFQQMHGLPSGPCDQRTYDELTSQSGF
jgi:Putative peptidoglycan binding domain